MDVKVIIKSHDAMRSFGPRSRWPSNLRMNLDTAFRDDIPEDRIITIDWCGSLGHWSSLNGGSTVILPVIIERILDPVPLPSKITEEFKPKILEFADQALINQIEGSGVKLYAAAQAISDPTKVSFFNKELDAFSYYLYKSMGWEDLALELRDQKAVMTRPGRFFAKFGIKDPQVLEIFTSHFIAQEFEIVTGEDVRKWYKGDFYVSYQDTSLQQSCMKHSQCQPYLDVYVDRADMLIGLDKDGLLLGRAIVWRNVKAEGIDELITFMDRVYGIETFQWAAMAYARKQGWYHKEKQNYCSHEQFINPNGANIRLGLKVAINLDYTYMPYMDTMAWLDGENVLNNTGYGRPLQDIDGNNENSECCTSCGDHLDEDHAHDPNGNSLCDSCYDEGCASCYHCGQTIFKDNGTYSEYLNEFFCPQCADRHVRECRNCGEYFPDTEMSGYDGQEYCHDCLTDGDLTAACPKCHESAPIADLIDYDQCSTCEEAEQNDTKSSSV